LSAHNNHIAATSDFAIHLDNPMIKK